MKKISLKDVKNGLKRDEMKVISGGCGGMFCANDTNCHVYYSAYNYMCINGFCRRHN